ncbi:hypothetical protein EV44_g5456 [Erysiphe necator]|uniref:Uncharacterized protein n=1 Tax=Uncinula necator TaxID=52586 RepID=A0A0B1P2A4_UNCNE|nr:hypothetical protein EV44_g5456 [Erysiphe necator]
MDYRTRPSKHGKIPPPFYLTAAGRNLIYCHTCGRVITPRKGHTTAHNIPPPVKYCSDRCRRNKPKLIDRQIEDAFLALLQDNLQEYTVKYKTKETHVDKDLEMGTRNSEKRYQKKGEHRKIVWCSQIQALVFRHQLDYDNKKKNDPISCKKDDQKWQSIDMENKNLDINQTQDGFSEAEKSKQGRQRAEEREMVRRVARRGVVFGFTIKDDRPQSQGKENVFTESKRSNGLSNELSNGKGLVQNGSRETIRMCEAVMAPDLIVVEPSFAKGDWGIRWREENP